MSEPARSPWFSERTAWIALLSATAVNCALQIAWFWNFRSHNITMDGIYYIGLARHLVDGDLRNSVHGYWSPLITWLIAGASIFGHNFTLLGRLVTIGSLLLCLPLLYLLTFRLWRSRVAAAWAVFWFSTARGIVAIAVSVIMADFLFAACVLGYFTLLLSALRTNRGTVWMQLGAIHAVAFLAKAFAMPWLAISTVVAVLATNARVPRRLATSLALAFLFPSIVWILWGTTLRAKYGVFTAGYQLSANLATNWRRHLSHHERGDDLQFVDTSSVYDAYMVGETASWRASNPGPSRRELMSMMAAAEVQNLPQAIKEMLILLGPGGIIALPAMCFLLYRRLRTCFPETSAEALFAAIAILSAVALMTAYCMLVFDARYVIPITPVLMAVAAPLFLPQAYAPDTPHWSPALQKTALALFAVGVVFFTLYWASPFRTVDRDFEASLYGAADKLRSAKPAGTLVSIGAGPYPDRGVGFEVGPYLAYLAKWRLVAGNSALPPLAGVDQLAQQALATHADAIAVWGSPSHHSYIEAVEMIENSPGSGRAHIISDPAKGEVGTLILRE